MTAKPENLDEPHTHCSPGDHPPETPVGTGAEWNDLRELDNLYRDFDARPDTGAEPIAGGSPHPSTEPEKPNYPSQYRPDAKSETRPYWRTIGRADFNWRKELSPDGQKLYRLLLYEMGDTDLLPTFAAKYEFDLQSALDELRQHALVNESHPDIIRLI